jgi:hypothetical protein
MPKPVGLHLPNTEVTPDPEVEKRTRRTFKHREGLSKPRKTQPKPHKFMALKPC